jgi:hypothetical protein
MNENIKDIEDRISATWSTILGLERAIEIMEDEIRRERRKHEMD